MIDPLPNPATGIPLLETKFYVPRWRSGLVSRRRLVTRLRRGVESRLTLVSAPAGFGKTTLLAEWLARASADRSPAGWVSLDQGDNDPSLFWTYVLTALQRACPRVGARALALLHSPQPPPIEAVLTTLVNEISAVQDDLALVLDDFHVVEAEPIHQAVAFLLDHLPPRLHLVIASRSDPPFPLARLRVRGQLTELRAADLRFTPDEVAAFLNRVMGLSLSPPDVAALEERTEGWIAGLQLAGLSMKGRKDVRSFVAAFSGDNRYIADYLVEEVLQRQHPAVRTFLLQTAILDRLSGPLCDAVTGGEGGSALLESLERGNLFVVSLDDRRRWYRYHHLFADVLQAQARKEDPDRVRTLHGRASAWYERSGSPADAVRHALAAGDLQRAAGLIERAWPAIEKSSRIATWLGWVRELPDATIRARPVLCMGYAWALINVGELEAGEAWLRAVERWLGAAADPGWEPAPPPEGMVVVDKAQFHSLPIELATARTYLAQALGDVAGAITYARRLRELVPEGNYLARGPEAALLGLAFWASGDLEAAVRTFSAAMASLERGGDSVSAIGGSFVLGDMQVARGRLREAAATYEQALARVAEQPRQVFPGVGELHVGLGELHRERGNLAGAERHLQLAAELLEQAERPANLCRWHAARARVRESHGDLDGALALLEEAERHHIRTPLPDVHPVRAMKVRILVAQGCLAEAVAWAHERGLSAEDDSAYLREFEHLTLARVLLARYAADRDDQSLRAATGLLQRLQSAAEGGARMGSVIEILVLQALADQASSDTPRALTALQRALSLAAPEGFVRIFVDEGEPMRRLLRHAADPGAAGDYSRRLLTAFEAPIQPVASGWPAVAAHVRPLTPREVEILRLVAAGMRTREIAARLFISPSTVKRHVANLYEKLDVGHRTAAVARANELGLL
jgi:LuxR family transcriptional regulator, maltose regulon positive regulatory protein